MIVIHRGSHLFNVEVFVGEWLMEELSTGHPSTQQFTSNAQWHTAVPNPKTVLTNLEKCTV